MQQVQTIKGLIDRDQLEVREVVSESGNSRQVRTEWFHNGELVRADGHTMILSGLVLGGEQVQM